MIDRRAAIRLALAAVPAAWLAPSRANAQDFQKFVPLLVDLPGWTGNKAEGFAVQMAGASVVTASREYKRDGATLNASIVGGAPAQGMLAQIQSGMKLETAAMRMSTSTIDGFGVFRTLQVKDNSGAILVAIGSNAVLSLGFKGVPEDEAFGLARRFDWKAIQAALPK
jgi:hypothetical protein